MNKTLHGALGTLRATVLCTATHLAPQLCARLLANRIMTPDRQTRRGAAAALPASGAERREMRIDDHAVALYQWGDPANEPYVLLSHGWSSFGLRFTGWVPRLRERGFAVVAFDQQAHGMSGGRTSSLHHFVRTLRAVGHHLGRPRAFVGHSMGASALAFALDPSWRPGRNVLIAPMFSYEESLRAGLAAMHLAPGLFDPFDAILERRTGTRCRDFDAARHVHEMCRPALVIHDKLDRMTPWTQGRAYARHWPGAELMTTEGLGHNRMLDHPSIVDAAIDFIAQPVPSSVVY